MIQFYRLLPPPNPGLAPLQDAMPLPGPERESAWDIAPDAKTKSPDEVDLEKLMAKLKALAAKAQQSPPVRTGNRHLAIAAAITLSVTAGAVTAQYVVPGHSRKPAGPSKSLVVAIPTPAAIATPIHR